MPEFSESSESRSILCGAIPASLSAILIILKYDTCTLEFLEALFIKVGVLACASEAPPPHTGPPPCLLNHVNVLLFGWGGGTLSSKPSHWRTWPTISSAWNAGWSCASTILWGSWRSHGTSNGWDWRRSASTQQVPNAGMAIP